MSAISAVFDTQIRILIFSSYEFNCCVQFSTMYAVFDILIWILNFSIYGFVRCVQLSAMSTVFDTLIRILMFTSDRFVQNVHSFWHTDKDSKFRYLQICPLLPVVHNVHSFWHTYRILMFPSYRFVPCVQLSTMSAVFETLVRIWSSLITDLSFVSSCPQCPQFLTHW